MAEKIVRTVIDDIDGTEGAETVTFSYKGTSYSIDLSDENAQKFEAAIEPYVSAARKTGRGSSSRAASRGGKKNLSVIRQWANANGHPVNERGRIPASVVEAYEAAN